MAEDFFKRFEAEMERQYPQAFVAEAALPPPAPPAAAPARKGLPIWVWGVVVLAIIAAAILLRR
jgi:hypothetical protein